MKTSLIILIAAIVGAGNGCSLPGRSRNVGDPSIDGKVLAVQVCASCHGVDGNAKSPNFPRLAGQKEKYFIAQMNGFKNHNRSDPAGFEYMWGISRSLTETQIKDLATYFARQVPVTVKASPGPENQDGKNIYETGIAAKSVPACSGCHGAIGEGMGAFPRIGAQHADYLVKQLQIFQRTNERPEGVIMKQITHLLSAQEIAAVAAYVENLPVR